MQAVILAAGEGMRMRPLTETTPKPLLPVAGKPILDHIFEALPDEINEVVLVVRYLGEQIREHCGEEFFGRRIAYAEGSPRGTAYSFLAAQPHLKEGRFLFIYGDELPSRNDIKLCLAHPASILCWEALDPWNHGVAVLNHDGTIKEMVEKPEQPSSNLITGGVMVLDHTVFDFVPEVSEGSEVYFTDMVNQFAQQYAFHAVMSERKIGGISTPEDIVRVEELLGV